MFKNKQKQKEEGITLVALIVTIIVLIIMAAVTIITFTETGLLKTVSKGTENYVNAQEYEQRVMNNIAETANGVVRNITEGVTGIDPVDPENPNVPEEPDEDIVETEYELRVYTKVGMEEFRDRVNNGETFEGKTIYLMRDIDLEGNNNNIWEPIGDFDNNISFKGTFNGNYHTISNLYYRGNSLRCVSLFGYNCGTIQNVVLENIDIYNSRSNGTSGSITTGIVAFNEGNINNCGVSSGTIANENMGAQGYNVCSNVAGICGGTRSGEITNCYNKANLYSYSPKNDGQHYLGRNYCRHWT